MKRWLVLLPLLLVGCASSPEGAATVSSTIAITHDDSTLWVVNPDADSVSVIDTRSRTRLAEVPLGDGTPAVDATTHRYDPAVRPRALALTPDGHKVYVAGESANRVYVIDASAHKVLSSIPVPVDPTGVVVSPDGRAVYVVSHEAAMVTKIDPTRDAVVSSIAVPEHPWGASVSGDSKLLYVTHLLLGAGVTTIDTGSFKLASTLPFAEQPPDPAHGKKAPNGLPRGAYIAVPRPNSGELWVPHLLLAVKTTEPALDFDSTVFPTISRVTPDGKAEEKRLLFQPLDTPGVSGAFTDVISGPHAVAFSPDGKWAYLADSSSEDVMVFNADAGTEVGLVRPIPSTLIEGIVVDHQGRFAYVDGRNSHNVTVLSLTPTDSTAPASVDGDPIDLLGSDPMPPELRLGQRLFYTANSAAFPITQNFWVACSSCHLEGGTDAVTWLFTVGPRDTPSNAGGPIHTGFLLRQALRKSVFDYDQTIDIEQGGNYHRDSMTQMPQLQALSDFVNYAIPLPGNPNVSPDGSLDASQQHGKQLFGERCASCHTGDWFTDSGAGNPTLDLNGPIVLHDIGTCVKGGGWTDQPAPDAEVGKMHTACDFDTPTLRGVFATAPYFHDGSATTLKDVLDRLPSATGLSDGDKQDLVNYVLTL